MHGFNERIVFTYLYAITEWGYPPPPETTLPFLERAAHLGFSSIELEGIRRDHLMQMYARRNEWAEAAAQSGLAVPYFCTVLPGLSSSDERERNANLELFDKGCQTAQVLSARGVLDNGPLPPYTFPNDIPVVRHYDEDVILAAGLPPSMDWTRYWNELVKTFRTVCDIAAGYGLTYHVHPALGVLANTTDGFLHFFDAVGRDNLRFTLDTANQHVFKENLILSLLRLRDHIDYIHLSDSDGSRIQHLEPGNGTIRWPEFLRALEEIDFRGQIGIDIGGAESGLHDLDGAYRQTAQWLEEHWLRERIET